MASSRNASTEGGARKKNEKRAKRTDTEARPAAGSLLAGGTSHDTRKADAKSSALGSIVQLGFIGIAAFAVYAFVGMAKDGELRRRCSPLCALKPEYAGASRKAPAFMLEDLDGKSVSLDSFRDKVVVLNMWSTTCRPCVEELPALAELTSVLKKRDDVVVVTITNDENAAEVRDFLKSVLPSAPPFVTLIDPQNKVIGGQFGTTMVPETWILDKQGIVRARFDGQRDWTSGMITQLIDQVRAGGYCPMEVMAGKRSGEGAFVCNEGS